jgi:hypothetical protein
VCATTRYGGDRSIHGRFWKFAGRNIAWNIDKHELNFRGQYAA